jgi:hypothetical protein
MIPKDFIKVLFNEDEKTCWGRTKFSTHVQDLPDDEAQFFSINPLKDRRLDINVTAYRNILVEIDTGTLEEQKKILDTVPFSTLVFSGGKSLHAIISLEEPLKTREEYDDLVRAVYCKVPECDKSAKNPSRFSRVPDFVRDNGVTQDLIAVRSRIENNIVYEWAGVKKVLLGVQPAQERFVATHKMLPVRTLAFLQDGAYPGNWNNRLFVAACDMFSVGYDKEEVQDFCRRVTGYLDKDDLRTIESARKNVQRES